MSDWLKSLRTCAFCLPVAESAEVRPGELSQINSNYEDQKKLEAERSEVTEHAAPNEGAPTEAASQQSAIQSSSSQSSAKPTATDTGNKTKKSVLLLNKQPKNEDNILYCSVEQKQKQKLFRVTVGQSEAAIRCSLQTRASNDPVRPMNEADKESPVKHYYLAFTSVSINLLDNPSRPAAYLYEWNFRNIRRYGCTIDSFSIEVGRKSKSGAGLFLFYTLEGATIFQLLAKYVNDLKNEALSNGLMKELTAADLTTKCRPISTLINIQPVKYEPTKYDSAANSPSSSSTSIKSSSCTSNESNLSDSAQSNSGDFTSLNEQKNEGVELIRGIHQKFSSQARHHQHLSHLNHQKVGEKIHSQSLPVARSVNPLLKTKLLVERNINHQNKEQNCTNEIIKETTNNPFLPSYRTTEIAGNELNQTGEAAKTIGVKAPLRPPKMDESEYNDVANVEHPNLPSRMTGNFSGKLLGNFPAHQQMNNKLSSCSVANLIEDQKLLHLHKLNKSLPQINQIGVVSGRSKLIKPTNETDHISYSSIISVDGNLDAPTSNLPFSQPNALAKPPRLSKLLLNGEPNKRLTGDCVLSETVNSLNGNEKAFSEKAFNKVDSQPNDEEPIFESRQDLFGYRKEENHYELADEFEAEGKEMVDKPVLAMNGPVNASKLMSTDSQADKQESVDWQVKVDKQVNVDRQMKVDKSKNNDRQVNSDKQTNEVIPSKESKSSNSLLPIDTYELLVNILNQIDEKSLNTATLKEAIKKAVLSEPSIGDNKTEEEFLENLLLSNNNNDSSEQATINYCVNDCEYAKIMKKKFMKKTIVEHF